MSDTAYFWTREYCRAMKLSSACTSVLKELADCHNKKTKRCDPSVIRISEYTNLNKKTVMNAIETLEELGAISTRKEKGKRTNYVFNFSNFDADFYKENGFVEEETSTKNGTGLNAESSTKNNTSTKIGSGTKIGITPVPKLGVPPVPKLGHEPINKPIKNLEEYIYPDVLNFIEESKTEIHEIYPSQSIDGSKWWDDIRLMIDNDGYSFDQIKQAWKWARSDSFWKGNIRSISKLRMRDKQGTKYIDVFLSKIKKPPSFKPSRINDIPTQTEHENDQCKVSL